MLSLVCVDFPSCGSFWGKGGRLPLLAGLTGSQLTGPVLKVCWTDRYGSDRQDAVVTGKPQLPTDSMKRPDWLKRSPAVVFGLIVLSVLGLGGLVIYLPQRQTASLRKGVEDYRSSSSNPDPEKLATLEKGRIDSENAIRTGLIQGIGGTVLLIGLYFTYQNLRATQRNIKIAEAKHVADRKAAAANLKLAEAKHVTDRKAAEANLKLAEAKQVTERFSKAVEMLSSGNIHTRLGGIYALERIAKDSDDDYWQVMEVLTAFVREESPWPPKPTDAAVQPLDKAPPVVEGEPDRGAAPQPELSWWEQRQAFRATLPPLRTDIQAVMTVIGRRQHRYQKGETQRLDLRGTDLRKLKAVEANLTGVDLTRAHLEGASLHEAHLEGALLSKAHLEGALLSGAHLKGANLYGAHLKEADLSGAHLEGAVPYGAHLEGACLWGTDLSQVRGLTQTQIDTAEPDNATKLPPHLHHPKPSPQPTTPSPSPSPPPTAPAASALPPATPGPDPDPPSPPPAA